MVGAGVLTSSSSSSNNSINEKLFELESEFDAIKEESEKQIRNEVKSFGDGIAFSYLDTHNLKQMAFDTETLMPKNDN